MSTRRKRRNYSDEFKHQIVDLHKTGNHKMRLFQNMNSPLPLSTAGSARILVPVYSKLRTI